MLNKTDCEYTCHCQLFVDNILICEYSKKIKITEQSPLEVKKLEKRLLKQCVFRLFKILTEVNTPWGSLTGVRPSKLMRELVFQNGETKAKQIFQAEFDVSTVKTELAFYVMKNQQKIIESIADNDFDVYIGIPFCPQRCTYCSFASNDINKFSDSVNIYLDKLIFELSQFSSNTAPRAIYIGGGTPSALNEEQIERLLITVKQTFKSPAEYTFEAGRPDTITPEKLALLKNFGVDRISINPQTMNDETLRIIGRNHTGDDIISAYKMAHSAGFKNINADLIAGLPNENLSDIKNTLDKMLSLSPAGITVHTLAKKRASGLSELPEVTDVNEMIEYCYSTLTQRGFIPYYMYRQKYMSGNLENVGYCKPENIGIYNIDIMEETVNILAFGCGAISKRIFKAENRIERAPNVSDLENYISRTEEMIKRKKDLFYGIFK